MKSKHLFLYALLIVVFACRKDLPQLPLSETPIFFTEMSGPVLNINLRAGLNHVSFSEETVVENQVKVYSGILQKTDTLFRVNFFPGEIFKTLNANEFMGITEFVPVSLTSNTLAQLMVSALTSSQFDNVNYTINQSEMTDAITIQSPGIYTIGVSAQRNGLNYESATVAVLGYENPYKFELLGNLNTGGPGIIIEGQIQNLSHTIEKIEWTCGSNTQTTTGTQVQFPTGGANNLLVAKITFEGGVVRTRTVGLGLENAPKIEDVVYLLENSSDMSFSNKIEIILETNGQIYSTRFATDFAQGAPVLNILNKSFYTDPVTNQKAILVHASGLIYVKNEQNDEIIPVQMNIQIGLPISF